ncbi:MULTISPECIES: gamma carbonic anhydrase family protein [Rhodococcus]|uniref:Carbonic anhydrase n=3 Tax=Rhodococcus TaxID=1827 RepID=V9X7E2_9NOCA|nr:MULTISPECIES: gamma carbonic anhydrase family protein [Rhodococcus]AHD19346.1 carbonic anhydrase [Rhodococcus pyridinivorans SB3094]APE08724.1 gamma carbonic anhydrase family protein [Rhodococcus sp. 2G]MCT7290048.1 gamma carbonic anhydrase family protein [Rhodococcus sp. PAE-6]QOW00444.1 gamma carbonic anhydrase family protein [Rhodococcus pyridinivorans]UPW04259.1 gamma carbonic anhydrase family protein [Rhodococcus pyridinivorans]
MAVYALGERVPDIHPDAWVHPDAVVIGNVTLGAGASVWPSAVLRGDYGTITVGEKTNIQDGTIIHCTAIDATVIGARCVVGHNAHIEGSTIGDGALIGSGSLVLNGSVIGAGAQVAAGALIPPRFELPPRRMAMGIPAKVREGYEIPENEFDPNAEMYAANAAYYRTALRRIDQE